ncbi:hypothetical protein BTVI_91059 [Pitangus sulphuratus]|nr:hypothetical protein BTVI_91059 [Pitangus sulphuratus]
MDPGLDQAQCGSRTREVILALCSALRKSIVAVSFVAAFLCLIIIRLTNEVTFPLILNCFGQTSVKWIPFSNGQRHPLRTHYGYINVKTQEMLSDPCEMPDCMHRNHPKVVPVLRSALANILQWKLNTKVKDEVWPLDLCDVFMAVHTGQFQPHYLSTFDHFWCQVEVYEEVVRTTALFDEEMERPLQLKRANAMFSCLSLEWYLRSEELLQLDAWVLKFGFLVGINCLCDLELFGIPVKDNKHKSGKTERLGKENEGQESK